MNCIWVLTSQTLKVTMNRSLQLAPFHQLILSFHVKKKSSSSPRVGGPILRLNLAPPLQVNLLPIHTFPEPHHELVKRLLIFGLRIDLVWKFRNDSVGVFQSCTESFGGSFETSLIQISVLAVSKRPSGKERKVQSTRTAHFRAWDWINLRELRTRQRLHRRK